MTDHHADQLARLGEHVEVSRPEPPPAPLGDAVAPVLLVWLAGYYPSIVGDIVRARDAYGRAKYQQPLTTDDGRDGVEDLRQGLGDALMYACKVVMRADRDDELTALMPMVRVLGDLLRVPAMVRKEMGR